MKNLLALLFTSFLAIGEGYTQIQIEDSGRVAPGLMYFHYSSEMPYQIHVLEVDLDSIYLEAGLAMEQITGQESTSSLVRRKGALAGINGGFSFSNDPWNLYHGDPKDLFVLNGKILSEPFSTRASLGYTTYRPDSPKPQRVFVDQLALVSTVEIHRRASVKITGINRGRKADDLILYTSEWGRATLTQPEGWEGRYCENQLCGTSSRGSVGIPDKGFVLSASGIYRDSLQHITDQKEGVSITHRLHSLLYPDRTPSLSHVSYHTAGPILLLEGEIISHQGKEQIPEHFVQTRHPRTALGIASAQNKVWMVVVDGRQAQLSVGMSLPELSAFLLDLGATEGYNLDGGGSSTMVIGERIVNSPSDSKERRRCDVILLYSKETQNPEP